MKKFLFIFCIVLCGCTFQTKHRGYVFPSDLEEKLSVITTANQLAAEIGDPQAKTIYGKEVWIYYGTDENYRGPLPLKYDNKTVLLAYIENGLLVKTEILHDKDLPNMHITKGETEIPAAIELNAIEELFNNIGRFSPAGLGQ